MAELLSGRSAVVVGIGPGLGGAIAAALAAAGASVLLVSRTASTLDEMEASIAAAGGTAHSLVADLDSPDDRARLAGAIAEQHGWLDILVHNAARHGRQAAFPEANLIDWRATMDTNLFAPLALTQALLPLLRKSEAPGIVFVSAMASRMVSSAGRAGYAISKAAINQAVRSLAFELGGEGIRVNAVVPGWMDGAIVESWLADPQKAPMVERARQAIPLGRIPTPEEVAGSVLYLASDLSRAVTGACIDANGGHYMGP